MIPIRIFGLGGLKETECINLAVADVFRIGIPYSQILSPRLSLRIEFKLN